MVVFILFFGFLFFFAERELNFKMVKEAVLL